MKYIYSDKRYIPGNTFSYNFAGGGLYIKKKKPANTSHEKTTKY